MSEMKVFVDCGMLDLAHKVKVIGYVDARPIPTSDDDQWRDALRFLVPTPGVRVYIMSCVQCGLMFTTRESDELKNALSQDGGGRDNESGK